MLRPLAPARAGHSTRQGGPVDLDNWGT
ncbi:hypothetical protein FRACA_10097 [Frankia canadensis]|uniref:Uncharacterized protein n=1 Tax=Frankia canadensis TaxID=1836972 RepID=A0A2I2KI43_9ACTN|nr:hypothetical protein FRACA_10097 [Frankia canadensis]SOU52628.1 hypothetical protein FRACA_10097 [Frankia canadensis]